MEEIIYFCDLCGRKQLNPKKKLFNFGVRASQWVLTCLSDRPLFCKKQICEECVKVIKEAKIC